MSSVALAQRSSVNNSSGPGATPELELLLGCCGCAEPGVHGSRIRKLLSEGLAWQELLTLAERHGLLPQLYSGMSEHSSCLPDDFLPLLRARFERNVRQTLFLTDLLGRVLDAFDQHGVPALVLKGPVLAQMLYGDVALRQFSDIDVLIRPVDVQRAKLALEMLGFVPNLALTSREEKDYISSGYEYSFDSGEHKSLVEVQWRILPKFYAVDFDTERFFDHIETVEVCGRSLKTVAAEDLLLVLCVHAAKHLWQKIAWIRDIAELTRSHTIDWELVAREARRFGIRRIVEITFYLAQELLEHTMPGSVQAAWNTDAASRRLGSEILESICAGREIETDSPAYFHLMLRLRERRVDQIRFLWRLTLTPTITEWRAVRLPAPLFPAYHLVRIGRLLGRFSALLRYKT